MEIMTLKDNIEDLKNKNLDLGRTTREFEELTEFYKNQLDQINA